MELFTSDSHFWHKAIVDYCPRPWRNVERMNEYLIEMWNSRVSKDDTVYHLGDFSFGSIEMACQILARLNGRKVLVLGNHDRTVTAMKRCGFDEVHKHLTLTLDGYSLALRHDPDGFTPEDLSADFAICGHVHEKWRFKAPNIVNVGVDQWDFAPVSLYTIIEAWDASQT